MSADSMLVSRSLPVRNASKPKRVRSSSQCGHTDVEPASLIRRCQDGDLAAERELYEASCPWIYQLALRMVGANDADDVCQQVYLQVFSKLCDFNGRAEVNTWLYRIAINEALQHLRRRRRSKEVLLEIEACGSVEEPRQLADHELLEKALGSVAPELKTVFLLREQDQLSYREIADVLQIPEGTVASRVNRARTELQATLRQLGWQP